MSETTMQSLAVELQDAENKLRATVERLYGKIESTDFWVPYRELQDVHAKVLAMIPTPETVVEQPENEEKSAKTKSKKR